MDERYKKDYLQGWKRAVRYNQAPVNLNDLGRWWKQGFLDGCKAFEKAVEFTKNN